MNIQYLIQRIFLIGVVLLMGSLSYGQETKLEKANRHYENMHYSEAIPEYERILKKTNSREAMEKLADCYRLTHNPEKAQFWYAKLVKVSGIDPINYFHYGRILMMNEQYNSAKEWFERYLREDPKNKMAQEFAAMCDTVSRVLKKPSDYRIHNVAFNSKEADFAPMYYGEGLVFTSSRTSGMTAHTFEWDALPFLDLYFIEKAQVMGGFSRPKVFKGKLQTKYHEGTSAYDPLHDRIYFTRNDYYKGKVASDDGGTIHLKIYSGHLEGKGWSHIEEFPYNASYYSCGHPAITENGDVLYFISDMPGGFGGTDLYVCYRQDSSWTDPVNLGPKINTAGDEMFPFIHQDGVLYFASDGHGGLGGLDIFSARMDEGKLGKVMHLGFPINSSRDDFSLIIDKEKKTGYFSSNRKGGKGADDLYSVVLPQPPPKEFQPRIEEEDSTTTEDPMVSEEYDPENPETMDGMPVFSLLGTIRNESGMPVDREGLKVILINTRTGREQVFNPEDPASWKYPLDRETEYIVKVEKPGYLVRRKTVSTVGLTQSRVLKADFLLEAVAMNRIIPLKNIYYDFDEHYIRPDAGMELNKWADFLKDNPGITVELSSHTDSRGSDRYNQKLSQRRAEAAVNYLIYQGVDRNRIVARGYGEQILVNNCDDGYNCPEADHQRNRRTEFRIIGMSQELQQQIEYNPNDHSYAKNTRPEPNNYGYSSYVQPNQYNSYPSYQNSNSYSSGNASNPMLATKEEGIKFKVQIGVFSEQVDQSFLDRMGQYASQISYIPEGGMRRYLVGSYSNYADANMAKEDIRRMGVPDAFVVAYDHGERISVQQAMQMVNPE